MAQGNGSGASGRAGRARRRLAATGAVALLATAVVLAGAATALAKPAAPVLAFTPSPYDYGRVTPGESASQRFTLANSGGKATGKLKVTLAGAAAFTITGDRCGGRSLGPGKSCTVTVGFAPTSAATVTATLTATSTKGATAAVALSGTGTGLGGGAAPGQIFWVSQDEIWAANLDGTNPHVIVTGQDVDGIAANSSHLYWANSVDGTISEANLDGTSPQVLVSGQAGAFGVAVDASHLYWTNSADGTIWRANLDGSDAQAIVTGQSDPFFMAITPPTTPAPGAISTGPTTR